MLGVYIHFVALLIEILVLSLFPCSFVWVAYKVKRLSLSLISFACFITRLLSCPLALTSARGIWCCSFSILRVLLRKLYTTNTLLELLLLLLLITHIHIHWLEHSDTSEASYIITLRRNEKETVCVCVCTVSAGVKKSEYVCRNEGEMLSGKRPNEFWHRVQLGFERWQTNGTESTEQAKTTTTTPILSSRRLARFCPVNAFALYTDARCVCVSMCHIASVLMCTAGKHSTFSKLRNRNRHSMSGHNVA